MKATFRPPLPEVTMIPIEVIFDHLSLGDKLALIQLLKAEGLL
jgi:hypothetical protein